jgi:hypothetical protein
MDSATNPFLLADDFGDSNYDGHDHHDNDESTDYRQFHKSDIIHDCGYYNQGCYTYDVEDSCSNSPKLINNKLIEEMKSFFKLNNLFSCIQKDEKKEPTKNISISKIIMDTVINKKLGTMTYHYANEKSSKAYFTYDYPEIYYNKKLYNNISQWLKEEFSKKI